MPEEFTKEDYLRSVSEQMSCKRAIPSVIAELSNHIDEQAECYIFDGMDEKAAEYEAVRQMGNPMQTGIELDEIHRPSSNVKPVIGIAVIAVIGLIIQYILVKTTGEYEDIFVQSMVYTIIGLVLMVFINYINYSLIIKRYWLCYALFYLIGFGLLNLLRVTYILGNEHGIIERTSMYYDGLCYGIVCLSIPLFAGLIFKINKITLKSIGISLISTVPTLLLCYSCDIVYVAIEIYAVQMIMMICVVFKRRKRDKVSKFICVASIISLPVGICLIWKLRTWLKPVLSWVGSLIGINSFPDISTIKSSTDISKWIGNSENIGRTIKKFKPSGDNLSDMYSVTMVAGIFGVIFAFVLMGISAVLVTWIIRNAVNMAGNTLGMLIAFGVSSLLIIEMITYIMTNFGMNDSTGQLYYMFLSTGDCEIISHFILFGFVLSVIRNKNILTDYGIDAVSMNI